MKFSTFRPVGLRVRHYGLLGWIASIFPSSKIGDAAKEFSLFLSSIIFLPALLSTLQMPNKIAVGAWKSKSDGSRNGSGKADENYTFCSKENAKWICEKKLISYLSANKTLKEPWIKLDCFSSAPCAKFYFDFAAYLTFVIMYTIVGFNLDYAYTGLELIVNLWILAMIIREASEWMHDSKLNSDFDNNLFDVTMLGLYAVPFGLRVCDWVKFDKDSFQVIGGLGNATNGVLARYGAAGDWTAAQSWHGIAGILFWIRIIDFFRVSPVLGPLVLILKRVTWDALQFFVILLVFMISFGTAILCAGRPRRDSSTDLSANLALAIFFPYLEIFGEHFLSDSSLAISNFPDCSVNQTCSPSLTLVVLICCYLFISSIILMNLLIASE